jgi:hypothetical protein
MVATTPKVWWSASPAQRNDRGRLAVLDSDGVLDGLIGVAIEAAARNTEMAAEARRES